MYSQKCIFQKEQAWCPRIIPNALAIGRALRREQCFKQGRRRESRQTIKKSEAADIPAGSIKL
jgi:hypothetical protein